MPSLLLVLLLAIPWLNPFTPGPSPSVTGALLSGLAAAVLLGARAVRPAGLAGMRSGHTLAQAWAQACVLAAGLSAAMALLQYLGGAEGLQPWVSSARLGEAFANLRQRNHFATLSMLGLVALGFLSQHTRAPQGLRAATLPWLRWGAVLLAALLGAANAASASRTGLLQLLLLGGLAWLWPQWHHAPMRTLLLAALLGYALGALALPLLSDWQHGGILSRWHEEAPACSSRRVLWGNVLHLIAQHPWGGWGWGTLDYAHFSTLYPGARFCDILDNAHNLPLHLAFTLGIPAALALCGGLLWWLVRRQPWRETQPARHMAWAILALIGLHSALEYPLWYGPFALAAALAVGLLWQVPKDSAASAPAGQAPSDAVANAEPIRAERAQPQPSGAHRLRWASMACALLLFVAYAGWDYWRISQIYLQPQERAPAYREHPLEKIQDTVLFRDQVRFAALLTTPLTPDNAAAQLALAKDLLYFSPEPRVVRKALEAALLTQQHSEARWLQARFAAAFPQDYAHWQASYAAPAQ